MKKEYLKPEILIQELLIEGIIATSDPEVTDKPVVPFTNKYQGGWSQEQWNTENYF